MLVPSFTYAHAPLIRSAVEHPENMADKLREACFAERERLEAELGHLLPVVSQDLDELKAAWNAHLEAANEEPQ